jgi:endoglucanase
MNTKTHNIWGWLVAAGCLALCSMQAQDQVTPGASSSGPSLISNDDFSTDANGDGAPDGWKVGNGITWESENGVHFLRLTQQEPGKMLMAYREVPIPVAVKAAELTIRYRTAGIKKGEKPWFDARTIIQFIDAARKQVKPGVGAIVFKPDTADWTIVTKQFAIPEGTQKIQLMPSLFQVAEGRIDFAEIRLVGIDPATLH